MKQILIVSAHNKEIFYSLHCAYMSTGFEVKSKLFDSIVAGQICFRFMDNLAECRGYYPDFLLLDMELTETDDYDLVAVPCIRRGKMFYLTDKWRGEMFDFLGRI